VVHNESTTQTTTKIRPPTRRLQLEEDSSSDVFPSVAVVADKFVVKSHSQNFDPFVSFCDF